MSEHDKPHGRPGGISVKSAEIVVAVLLLLLGSVVAYDRFRLGARWSADGPKSGYFPFYIGLIVAIASLITPAQELFAKSGTRGAYFFHNILTFVKDNRVSIAVA
jgi:hypothetical protein